MKIKTAANRTPAGRRDGAEWNAIVARMTKRHGFDLESAWTVVTKISQQAGAAAKLDALMAVAEVNGTSAHDLIISAFSEANAA